VPCYRCGRVQTDPVKGASPWARGVVKKEQILICPDCQQEHPQWTGELDRCPSCGGTRLSMVMGSLVCRQCGYEGEELEGHSL
jgi:predicted amidophosphoribosyltransferase